MFFKTDFNLNIDLKRAKAALQRNPGTIVQSQLYQTSQFDCKRTIWVNIYI